MRDLLSKGNGEWTVADVAGASKSANKDAVEEVLERPAALGTLAAYKSRTGRRWKRTRPAS